MEVTDYLGKVLNVGDECIRPEKLGNVAEFSNCEIISINKDKGETCVEIRGIKPYTGVKNLKTGWTFPRRLLKV